MGLYAPIEKQYPKVKPLAMALIAAAAEQGATVEEFEMACARAMSMTEIKIKKSAISEFEGDA